MNQSLSRTLCQSGHTLRVARRCVADLHALGDTPAGLAPAAASGLGRLSRWSNTR
jgi:hypothetical protein